MVDLLMLLFRFGLTLGFGLRFYFLSIQKYSYNPHIKDKEQSINAIIPPTHSISPE